MDLSGANRADPLRLYRRDPPVHRLDGLVDGLPLSRRRCAMMRASLAQPRRAAIFAAVCGAALVHADCDDDAFDPASQIGPNPTLPAPHQYLFPPMHLSSVTGWKTGEKPTVPDGLKVKR